MLTDISIYSFLRKIIYLVSKDIKSVDLRNFFSYQSYWSASKIFFIEQPVTKKFEETAKHPFLS